MEQEESCKHDTGNIESQKSAAPMPGPLVLHTFGYSVCTLLQMCLDCLTETVSHQLDLLKARLSTDVCKQITLFFISYTGID